MKKLLITRSLAGIVVGVTAVNIITILVNYLGQGQALICMPELTERLGFTTAVVVQTLLGALLGVLAIGGMCFFDIEEWSLLRASVAHFALILFSYMTIGLLLHWFSFHIIPILIMTFAIIFAYALIWLIMYLAWKREVREMNRLAEEYKKDAEAKEN
jgi:hypothetical protein